MRRSGVVTADPEEGERLTLSPAEAASLEEEIQAEARSMGPGDLPGIFITFEGGEGAGKSTQIARAAAWMQGEGIPVLATHEPGATPLGQALRSLALGSEEPYGALTELFLMLADRSQHVSEVIRPSLAEGLVVLCDRFNDSTLAYQARAGGLDEEAVRESCSLATGGLQPHLTLLLDIDPTAGFRRMRGAWDRMEKKGPEFHARVRQAFLDLAAEESGRFMVIDASQPEEAVPEAVQTAIRRRLGGSE